MKRTLFAVLTGFLLLGNLAVNAQLNVPKIDIKHRKLSNGLTIVSHKDNSNPTVAIYLLYRVGGMHDPIGKSGFAHMFEHMMFKSTKNMPSETIDRLTEDVGGFNNATTGSDFTTYFEVVPSNHLERLLWAEADRMVNLNVDEANFNSEREVVKEEFRQRVLANPYGRFFEMLDALSFQKHTYKNGIIGDLEQLDAATQDDAAHFYRDYYRPDNAILVVVGDFDQRQFDGWVDKYLGAIKRPTNKLKVIETAEPGWTTERRFKETGPIVPFPATAVLYQAPPANHKDAVALKLASNIMSAGESSRLYQSLVRDQKVAQEASFSTDLRIGSGLIYFMGIGSDDSTSEKLENAFLAELKKLQQNGVTEKELTKAKNQMIAQTVRSTESNSGKAGQIVNAVGYFGNPLAFNDTVKNIQKVTISDIKRVVNLYFKDNNRVVIHYDQAGTEAEGK